MAGTASLRISVTFPHSSYSGAEFGAAEELPSPARLHEAFVAAAAGGSWASVQDRVLVATDAHRAALEWLESTEPMGIVAPETRLGRPTARRFRWRASPVTPVDTDFEPRSALAGPVVYVWPAAPAEIAVSLQVIARDVTHVGRADSVAIVEVTPGGDPPSAMHMSVPRRGPGRVLRVPGPGRTAELVRAHADAIVRGGHTPGSSGKQAPDVVSPVNETATALRRFAPRNVDSPWPYDEVWVLPITRDGSPARRLLDPELRVSAAVGVHRGIVRAIGADVPSFVTGRDGDGPLRGTGHLAIQIAADDRSDAVVALLGLPTDVPDADREMLRDALDRPRRFAVERAGAFTLDLPRVRSALPLWRGAGPLMRTDVPLVLDAVGRPRHAPWSITDAVTCSVAYAMRAVLEQDGVAWGNGWDFRRRLVTTIRDEYGVVLVAARVPVAASRFVHRVGAGELVVAAHAIVNLGRLAPEAGGFLALGRARHLGGGLLVPQGAP